MFLIELFFLVLFFLFWKVLSKTLGNIGEHFYGEKGEKIGRLIPLILFCSLIAYQIIEYIYIRHQVQNLCKKEAGIFVYVTPEQWKEENKDVLDILYPYSKINVNDVDKYEEMQQQKRKIETYYKTFNYHGDEYEKFSIFNRRIVLYQRREELNYFTIKVTNLLVDIKTDKVLVKTVYAYAFVTGFMSVNRLSDLKFWMNEMPNCHDDFAYSSKIRIYEKFSNPSLEKERENNKQNAD